MTKKAIIIAIASIALAATCAPAVFAETSTGNNGNSATTANITAKITCVGAAVNTREQAIGSAMTAYTGSVSSAYTARATALQQAYTQTTLPTVRSAVKAAWSSFNSAAKSARQTWMGAKNTAWTQYRTAAVACKAPANTGDGANASMEVSGQ